MTMRFNPRTLILAAILSVASSSWLLADFEQELQQLQRLRDSGQITAAQLNTFTRQLHWKYNAIPDNPNRKANVDGLNVARAMHAENSQQRTWNDLYRANTERLTATGEYAKSISRAEHQRAKTIDQLERTRDIRLDNDLKSVEVRYAMRQVRSAYVEQEREERRIRLAEARRRKLDNPLMLTSHGPSITPTATQHFVTSRTKVVDASTGQIVWPEILTQPSLRSWSDHLDALLVDNRETRPQARIAQLEEAQTVAKEIHEQLHRMKSNLDPKTFEEVQQFMIALRGQIDVAEKYQHSLLLRNNVTQGGNSRSTTAS